MNREDKVLPFIRLILSCRPAAPTHCG